MSTARICILTSVHYVGDTRIYHRQARSLAEAGYRVTLIATEAAPAPPSLPNAEVISLPQPRSKFARPFNWPAFIKTALATKADIYHFHDPDLLLPALFLQKVSGKPVIYDNHDPYIEAILQREWLPVSLRPAISRTFDLIEKFTAHRLAAVIVANDSQQARFPQATLVRNYPDLAPFTRAASDSPSRCANHIVHVGDLTEPRGVFDLLEIARNFASSNIKFSLLGGFANSSLEAEVIQRIGHYHLQDLVVCEGRVPHQRVVSVLKEATVGLIPWRDVANHRLIVPTKLFEYMACGLPIVASDLPSIRSYITETNCGFLVAPAYPAAVTKAITYLLDHPAEARLMGEQGRRAVIERYNWASEAKKLLTLYQSLLAG